MRCIVICLECAVFALAVGCGTNPAQPQTDAALLNERALALAKQVREAMTDPSMMQLEYVGPRAESGTRGIRQREAAQPFMRKLVKCGKAAEESLWQLINDADESVRRSSVMVFNQRMDEGGKPIQNQVLIDLNIPLLERSLKSSDSQVRFYACAGLGDYAIWSDECLERLRISLPKLRELRNDSEKDVRSIAWHASNNILATLSTRAKNTEDRVAAKKEWEQLQQEKHW